MTPDQTNGKLDLVVLRAELQAESDRLSTWLSEFDDLRQRVQHRIQGVDKQLEALDQLDRWQQGAREYPVPELPELPQVGLTEHVDGERIPF